MKIGFINCPRNLAQMPETWNYDLSLELAAEEEKGNQLGLTDNAMLRVGVDVLAHQAKTVPVDKIVLYGGLPEYQFIRQYLEALKPLVKEVTVRGFPKDVVDLPIEDSALKDYSVDEYPNPSWFHFPLPDYWRNSPLPYSGDMAQLTKRSPFKSTWENRSPASQLAKKVVETMRFLRLVYGYDWLDWQDDLTIDKNRTQETLNLFDEYDLAGLFQWSCRLDPEHVDRDMVDFLRLAGCRLVDLGELNVVSTRDLAHVCRLETAINVCRGQGLWPTIQCVLGSSETEKTDLVEAVKFLKKMDLVHRSKLIEPYPETAYWDKWMAENYTNEEAILAINRGFINLTGWSDEELLGIVELMARGDLERIERMREPRWIGKSHHS